MKTCEDCIHISACITSVPPVPICDNFADKAEFVQVVRCKDCKRWSKDTLSCDFLPECTANWYEEDFCSYGERRGEDAAD